jgi:hypothetical protein
MTDLNTRVGENVINRNISTNPKTRNGWDYISDSTVTVSLRLVRLVSS